MERLHSNNPIEIAANLKDKALNVAKFIGHQILGGGWSNLPREVKPANIQLILFDGDHEPTPPEAGAPLVRPSGAPNFVNTFPHGLRFCDPTRPELGFVMPGEDEDDERTA